MKLGKTKAGRIEPLDNELMFQHCANGMTEVCEPHYFDVVEPLLTIHGISNYEYTWQEED